MQINRPGTLTWWRLDPMGMPQTLDPNVEYASTCVEPALGKLVRHFTYDGVGRLARTSTPLEAPEGWTFQDGNGNAVTAFTRSERFVYDGVRRAQEIVTDPVMTDGEGNRVATMSAESEQRGGSHGGSGQGGELPEVNLFLRAQYVWGPGDNGVDELLCQIEPYSQAENHTGSGGPQGKPWFILTDAQGDVVSIASIGIGVGGGSPIASVAGQWTYSPYGEVLTYDGLSEHPAVVFGHKTLAIDRLDAPALTWENESVPGAADGALFETRRLEPGARLLAYARNRTLDIQRGRWLQNDPNATCGLAIQISQFNGSSIPVIAMGADIDLRVSDGLNLFSALRNRPLASFDPLGLSLLGIGLGDAAERAAMYYKAADKANSVRKLGKALISGVDWQQEMVLFAVDMLLDSKGGGQLAEKALPAIGKSSQAIYRSVKFAEYQWHHIFPKFLGGAKDGVVALLPKHLHEAFHGQLYTNLAARGIKLTGEKGYTWTRYFEDFPEKTKEAIEILKETTKTFDKQNGTKMFDALLDQLK